MYGYQERVKIEAFVVKTLSDGVMALILSWMPI